MKSLSNGSNQSREEILNMQTQLSSKLEWIFAEKYGGLFRLMSLLEAQKAKGHILMDGRTERHPLIASLLKTCSFLEDSESTRICVRKSLKFGMIQVRKRK